MLLHACIYCQATAIAPVYKRADGRTIVRCADCGLQFITDVPDNLAELYGAEYFDKSDAAAGSGFGYASYSQYTAMQFRWQLALLRLFEGARAHRGTTLLDLGCATGRFLQMASLAGFVSTGMEISEAAAGIVRQQGYPVIQAALEDASPAPSDIATAWDVIEHVVDIGGMLRKIRGALRDGGSFMFSTPDGGAPRAAIDGERWSCLTSSFEHITYLTQPFLKRALTEAFGAEPLLVSFDVAGEWTNIIGFVRVGGPTLRDRRVAELLAQGAVPASAEELRLYGSELGWFYCTFEQTAALERLIAAGEGVLPADTLLALRAGQRYKAGDFAAAIPMLKASATQEPLSLAWLAECIERREESRGRELQARLDAQLQSSAVAQAEFAQAKNALRIRNEELTAEGVHLRATLEQIHGSLSWKIGRGVTSTIERVPGSQAAIDGLKQLRGRAR